MYVCMYTYMHIYIYMYIHIHIDIYIYIDIDEYAYAVMLQPYMSHPRSEVAVWRRPAARHLRL